MELKKLEKRVLKLWYIRAAMKALVLFAILAVAIAIVVSTKTSNEARLVFFLSFGIAAAPLLLLVFIMPALRYQMYAWGYDDKRIVVKQGVIFRHRVVIPICQIQDLHRNQGPLMMLLKLSGVTISTAGSNFDISTLTTEEADLLIDTLERALETRVEELKNEEI